MATDTQKNSTKTQKQAKAKADGKAPAAKAETKAKAETEKPLSRCAQLRENYRKYRDVEKVKTLAAKLGLKENTAKLNIAAVKREERDAGNAS